MRKDHARRHTGSHRRKLVALTAAVASVAVLAIASPAMATPKGIFSVFSQCPVTSPGVTLCSFGQTTSGEFAIGTTKVPINKTITLQGGAIPTGNPENEREYFLVPAKDGNSLSKTELNVPGGLSGLVNCEEIKGSGIFEVLERASCKAIFENGVTGVTEVTELAASTTHPAILNLAAIAQEEGTGLTLPVKVHLKNPLLGNSCYIGSETNPVTLHLTSGQSGTLHGSAGDVSQEEEKEQVILKLSGNSLVDNTYTAPAATGCGEFFAFLIDPIVNSKLKLPSGAGKNKAILNGTLRAATTEAVIASEKF